MTDARDDLVARVLARLAEVHDRVASTGRDPGSVTIVAVTKTFGVQAASAAVAAGLVDLGESYAQELVADCDAFDVAHRGERATLDAVRWHFLGALQSNKLARLAPRVAIYESLSSVRHAGLLARHAPGARCYVQVEVTGEPGRGGCARGQEDEVVAVAREEGLVVEGLMCVASPDPRVAEGQFAWLRRAADALGLAGCSMGMSGDYEAACRQGATALRLGTALFGPRASRPDPGVA